MSIGKKFAYLREAKGMTPLQAAAGIVTEKKLMAFEADKADIPLAKFNEILLTMGLTLRQFASYTDWLAMNKNTLSREIGSAYAAHDTVQLRKLYELVNSSSAVSHCEFLSKMTAAGYYYELTGTKLVGAEDEERLAQELLQIVSWNEAEVATVIATVPLLGSSRLFTVSREVMRGAPVLRDWNYSLYVGTWTAVMRALSILIERQSTFAGALLRQIDDAQPMAEGMIQNRFKLLYLRQVLALSKRDDERTRQLVARAYVAITPLAPAHLLAALRTVSIKAADYDPAVNTD